MKKIKTTVERRKKRGQRDTLTAPAGTDSGGGGRTILRSPDNRAAAIFALRRISAHTFSTYGSLVIVVVSRLMAVCGVLIDGTDERKDTVPMCEIDDAVDK